MVSHRPVRRLLPALLLGLLVPAGDVAAQAVPGVAPTTLPGPGGWAPPTIGVRLGWDNKQRDEVVGGYVRLPILPSGELELMGSVDATFLAAITEYQYNVEGVYVWDGRAGGLYGGIGIGLRNTYFNDGDGRSNELGYSAVVGVRFVGLGLVVPQIEYRWIFIDEAPINYQQLSLGVGISPWRHVAPR
jgi:hypothetical protein